MLAATSLGRRLGNCTSSPKSFQVRFQGGSPVTVTFNTDLTNTSNAAVLAIINAALGSAGAADLWAVANETFRPRFRDEERTLLNAGASAILRRQALAFDASRERVRPMTSADPLTLFAGIAWQDILPGETGRVKTRGQLPFEDLLATADGAALAFGESFGIDPGQPGRLVKTGAGLLRVSQAPGGGLSSVHDL